MPRYLIKVNKKNQHIIWSPIPKGKTKAQIRAVVKKKRIKGAKIITATSLKSALQKATGEKGVYKNGHYRIR